MKLLNSTPLSAFAFRQFDMEGGLDCIVAVRGTFVHVQDGAAQLGRPQEPFQWEDRFGGDPHQTMLERQSDLTPDRPGTDVTFLGQAHAPGGEPRDVWQCRLKLGPVDKALDVCGPRRWLPRVKERWAGFGAREPRREVAGWDLERPDAVPSVPLEWQRGYGGRVPGTGADGVGSPDELLDEPSSGSPGGPAEVDERNPFGCGIVNAACTQPVAAPQITRAGETLRAGEPLEPAGFAPIPPWWAARARHVGTYDEAWRAERHPLLPRDFDPRHWQCAPPDQVATPHLAGDEPYALTNLHPGLAEARGRLPGVTLGVRVEAGGEDRWQVLALEGVQFDWRRDERVVLTWRARFPLPDAMAGNARLTLNRVVFEETATPEPRAARGPEVQAA